MTNQSQRWTFTINNYTQWDEEDLHAIDCKYIIYGKEHCPTTGTPHLQGYVVFNSNKRLVAVKKVHATAHWEIAKSTTANNVTYCSKADPSPYERGVPPKDRKEQHAAQKEHYADVIRAAKEGTCEEEYPAEFLRYHGTIDKLYSPDLKDIDSYCGFWYYGPPGSGKSLAARKNYPGAYDKLLNKWWDGYKNEESVIIDDLDMSNVHMGQFMKRYADHYVFRAEHKGGSRKIRPLNIIVTSNYLIEEIWPNDPSLCLALQRRYKLVKFSSAFPITKK